MTSKAWSSDGGHYVQDRSLFVVEQTLRDCEEITFNAETAEAAEKKCPRISQRGLRALRSNVAFFHRLFRPANAGLTSLRQGYGGPPKLQRRRKPRATVVKKTQALANADSRRRCTGRPTADAARRFPESRRPVSRAAQRPRPRSSARDTPRGRNVPTRTARGPTQTSRE